MGTSRLVCFNSHFLILTVHHNKYSKSPTRNSSLARIISINTCVVD